MICSSLHYSFVLFYTWSLFHCFKLAHCNLSEFTFLWLMHWYLLVSVENYFVVNTWNVWCHSILRQVGGARNTIWMMESVWAAVMDQINYDAVMWKVLIHPLISNSITIIVRLRKRAYFYIHKMKQHKLMKKKRKNKKWGNGKCNYMCYQCKNMYMWVWMV